MTEKMSLRRIKAIIRAHERREETIFSLEPRHTPLQGADLSARDLHGLELENLDLRDTCFHGTNLANTYFWKSNLTNASFRYANLTKASFMYADLANANFLHAMLSGIDLHGASGFVFPRFPSITVLSSISLRELPNDLTLELMRRDAYAHPYPGRFAKWAKGGDADCPYQDEMPFWRFYQDQELWKRGNPTMKDRDLIVAICKAKGWGIEGHLKCAKND